MPTSEVVPWWAFWRRRAPSGPAAAPDGVVGRDRVRPPSDDEEDRGAASAPAFSGASPDAGLYALPDRGASGARHDAARVDAAALVDSGEHVAELVVAVLAGGAAPQAVLGRFPAASPTTFAATTSATAGLAARLPALSGVTGPAAVPVGDEPPDELLRAYALLLATRSAARGLPSEVAASRDELTEVARAAAAAAHLLLSGPSAERAPTGGGRSDELVRRCTTGLPARTQLLAACQLLAQTSLDGSAGAASLPAEIAELFGDGGGRQPSR